MFQFQPKSKHLTYCWRGWLNELVDQQTSKEIQQQTIAVRLISR